MFRVFAATIALLSGSITAVSAQEAESYLHTGPVSVMADEHTTSFFNHLNESNNTLYEAISMAYENNPTARAARAELLAVEEQLEQAKSGYRPTISADGDITHTDTDTQGQSFITSDGANTSKSGALNLSQPLFRGGTTAADISGARNSITAQSLSLSATEQNIIYEAATAYMDVLQTKAILELNEKNYNLVSKELEQAQNRFTVGEVTRTDVSQSEARLAAANANIITAKASFKSAIAVYRRIIGSPPPIDMAYPEKLFDLPDNLDEAISISQTNNREVLQAKFINAAAEDNVDSVFGELMPQVTAKGSLNKSYDPSDFIEEQRQTSIGIMASIPLYQAGSTRSRIREAKKRANQRYIQILEAQNRAKQETISNWEELEAAKAETVAREAQINAARIAQEGVHYETEFGERTTLDALDANQELLDAQVGLVTAKRNEIVARFALGRSLGLLVPQNFGFSSITP